MVTNSKLTLLLVNFMHFTKHNIYKEYILINLISDIVLRDNSLKPVLQSTNYVILKIFKIETFWSTLTAQIILLGVIGMCSIHFMKFFCFLRGHTFWLTQNSCCVYLSFIWLLFRKYRNISLISVALSPPKLSHSAGVWGETGRSGNQGRQGFRVYVWLLGFKKV